MDRAVMKQVYFDWLLQKIYNPEVFPITIYTRLMHRLFDISFYWLDPMDVSRADDAFDLRYRFGREAGFTDTTVAAFLDVRDASVLEMMVALAMRMEEHILGDNIYDNRTPEWFWVMITSMHLDMYDDRHYTDEVVDSIVLAMLHHRYSRNGDGGLFTIDAKDDIDMRKEDIWYQMMHWINQNIIT